jgi:hypothetical protein
MIDHIYGKLMFLALSFIPLHNIHSTLSPFILIFICVYLIFASIFHLMMAIFSISIMYIFNNVSYVWLKTLRKMSSRIYNIVINFFYCIPRILFCYRIIFSHLTINLLILNCILNYLVTMEVTVEVFVDLFILVVASF